jgi:hypothetical protein
MSLRIKFNSFKVSNVIAALISPHGREQLNCLWKLLAMVRILDMRCLA